MYNLRGDKAEAGAGRGEEGWGTMPEQASGWWAPLARAAPAHRAGAHMEQGVQPGRALAAQQIRKLLMYNYLNKQTNK